MEEINQALSNLNLGNGEDRISHLPESVLTRILSRLTNKDAMLTSIQSWTWRKKWTSIFNLHFYDGVLYANEVTNKQIFINFVEKSYFPWKNDDYEMLWTLPPCIMISHERVYFTYRFGNSIGFHLMKLLLQNAQALQLMSICALEIPNSWKTEIKSMLLVAPRASKNAIIEVK
ncbi:hypothetical protein ACH5RR_028059 [Cinchona calisaya]|uniref:F-box domain-containing protein n=1 Tax=Cinchona calisaya TaxID=153742 RepID=A0ABD2YNV6_9GENT